MKRKSIALTTTLLVFGLCSVLSAQPTAFTHAVHPLEYIDVVVPEPIDLQAVVMEDLQREQQVGPYRFAIQREVNITPQTDGLWEEVDEDTLMWRLPIASPDAVSLNLGFTRYIMPAGGQLYIYSVDESHVLEPFTEKDNKEHHQLWTPIIYSDAIIVELTIPASEVPQLELELTSINHGYRGFDSFSLFNVGDADDCQINAICPEGNNWRNQIRSVAWYHINGTTTCTGTLINNTAQDDKPYFLTGFHCFDRDHNQILTDFEKEASKTMVVYWNFEAYNCSDINPTVYSEGHNQLSATFKAGYWKSDFALVELDDMPSQIAEVYYSGWDRSSDAPSSGAAIHHPRSDLKKISIKNGPLDIRPTAINYGDEDNPITVEHGDCFRVEDWDRGGTEKGSSGCPFFNSSKRVVGQLIGGAGTCGTGSRAYYGPLYRSWTEGGTLSTRLMDWLDPLNNGTTTLNGKNPEDDDCGALAIDIGTQKDLVHFCPLSTEYEDGRTQVIYLANEIGQSGPITGLALDVTILPGQRMYNWKIRMKHTSKIQYEACNSNTLEESGWTTVYQGNELIDRIGSKLFEFQRSFRYNGNSNLMIDFSYNNSSSSSNGICRWSNTARTRSIYIYSNGNNPLEGGCAAAIPNIYLIFNDCEDD